MVNNYNYNVEYKQTFEPKFSAIFL